MNRLLQKCEGQKCPAREQCWRYRVANHPAQPLPADYSQVASFKPAAARESCTMFLIIPESDKERML